MTRKNNNYTEQEFINESMSYLFEKLRLSYKAEKGNF